MVHHLIFFQPKTALTEKKKGKGIERKIDPKSENKRNHTLLGINQDTISYSKKKYFTNLNKLRILPGRLNEKFHPNFVHF